MLKAVARLVDPTFDPPGEYPIGARSLTKTSDAVVRPDELGRIDAVLLSHDQHRPDGTEHLTGPVIGFVLTTVDTSTVYISGDNASLRVVREVAERFVDIDVAVLFAGAARTALVDGFLTLHQRRGCSDRDVIDSPKGPRVGGRSPRAGCL